MRPKGRHLCGAGGERRGDATRNRLRAVYTRSSRYTSPQVFEAARASLADAFTPTGHALVHDLQQFSMHGSLSPDGLVVYFERHFYDAALGKARRHIYTSHRADVSLPFDAPVPVDVLAVQDDDLTPYVAGSDLWFTRLAAPSSILHVPLFMGSGAAAVPEPELSAPAASASSPVASADGLTVFFTQSTTMGMLEARRATLQSPFTIRRVCELATEHGTPSWLSPDGCRLYFTSTTLWQAPLRVASRCPAPP